MQDIATVSDELTNFNKISGYKLSNLILRNGRRLNLKSSEVLIFATLATYYNGKPIFPRITTLCNDTNLSDKAVRTAITGLVSKGYLLKSKRQRNANLYAINISAVNSALESGKNECTSAVNSTAPIHEVKPCINQTNNHVVSLEKSLNEKPQGKGNRASRTEALFPIPQVIKDNPNIRNINAYWASLSVKAKNEWYEKQKEHDHLQQVKRDNEIFRQNEKLKQEQEQQEIRDQLNKPINERFTPESARQIYDNLRRLNKGHTGLATELKNAFNL